MLSVVIYCSVGIIFLVRAVEEKSAGKNMNGVGFNKDEAKVIGAVAGAGYCIKTVITMAAVGSMLLIITWVQLYFWFCVFSFLKELRSRTLRSPA